MKFTTKKGKKRTVSIENDPRRNSGQDVDIKIGDIRVAYFDSKTGNLVIDAIYKTDAKILRKLGVAVVKGHDDTWSYTLVTE